MNSLQLLESIQRIHQPTKDDLVKLIKLHKAFPYFQIPKVLLARYEFQKSNDNTKDMLHHAAVASPDRIWLKQLVEKEEAIDNIIAQFNPGLQKAIAEKGPQNPENIIDDLDDNLVPTPSKKPDPAERNMLLKKLGEELIQAKNTEAAPIAKKAEVTKPAIEDDEKGRREHPEILKKNLQKPKKPLQKRKGNREEMN